VTFFAQSRDHPGEDAAGESLGAKTEKPRNYFLDSSFIMRYPPIDFCQFAHFLFI